jgi:hypothetical protein
MFCPNCGQQIPSTARFCPSCGSQVNPVSDLASLPDSIFTSDPPSEQPATFPLLSGNRVQISQTTLRIENSTAAPLLDLPVPAILAMRRQGAELILTRHSGETIAITFSRIDDASQAERILVSAGVRIEEAPAWAPQPVATQSTSLTKSFGIGCAVLLGVCMVLGIIGSLVNTGSTASPGMIASQQQPTAIRSGSSSAILSSAAYESAVLSQSDALSVSMGRFAVLAQNPQFYDGQWKIEVSTELAVWRATYRDAQAMAAPSGYEAFHRKYMAALSQFDAAASKVARGIDTINPDLIEDASADMDAGTRLIDEAMDEFPS